MWPYLRRHRRDVVIVFGAALCGMAVTAVLPLLVRSVVDDAIVPELAGRAGEPLAPLLLAMLGLGVVRFALSFARRFGAGRLGIDVEYDMRNDIYDHLHRLDFARHDEMQSGQLVSRANTDVRVVQMLLGFLPFMSGNVLLFGLSVVFMVRLSLPLTAVALVTVPILLLMAMQMRKVVYPSSWDAQQRAAELATVVEEATSGVRVVKGFGQERRELGKLEGAAVRLFGARMRNARISAQRQAIMQTVPGVAQVAILALGGWLAMRGHISLGTLLAFQTYLLQLVAPVRQFAGMLVVASTTRAAAERIFELLDSTSTVQERPDARSLGEVRGEIAFEDVRFGYLRSEPVLDGLSLRVAPGETVALVGASGSGKSTVSLLLPRFYDAQGGAIRIDGTDVRDLTLDSLRRHLGVVFEETFLFSDTIRANIGYGRPDATDEEVSRAARWARAHDFVTALPDGYDTEVGERGLTLSGGQRQRIALARALLTDPRVLLLDDATSSIDAQVEEEIHETLREVMRGRTTILVAHRRSTLNLADRIAVLDQGRVVDSGTHDELHDRCELYRRLLGGSGDDLDTTAEENELVAGGAAVAVPPVAAGAGGGITASAWGRTGDDAGPDGGGTDGNGNGDGDGSGDTPADLIARTQRAGYLAARQAAGAGAGAFGGAGMSGALGVAPGGMAGGMGMGFARLSDPPTPELLARIEALPPIVDSPEIDLEEQARPAPAFSFRQMLTLQRGRLVGASVLVGGQALAGLAGPAIVSTGVERGVRGDSVGWLLAAAGLFLTSIAVTSVLLLVSTVVSSRIGQELLLGLRVRVFAHLQRLSLDFYDGEMTGRIMTRMTSDIEAMQAMLQTGFIDALVQLVTFVGAIAILATMNGELALVVLAVVPPLVLATVLFRRRSATAYGLVRDRIAAVNANLQESISGVRVAQAFVREGRNIEGFRAVAGQHRAARIDSTLVASTYFPFVEMLSTVATVLVLWAGSSLVTSGDLTVGPLFAFVLYLTVVFSPIQQLSQVFDQYQQGSVALDRLRTLLATPSSLAVPDEPAPVGRLRGELRFEGVSFAYSAAAGTAPAVSGVDLVIRPGETVAFVGRTGAGKSTLVKLAARLYDPTEGRILADGVPLTSLDLEGYRRQLGYVPQEAFLFTGTIRDNIAYARPDATDAEVEAAARAVGAHEFVARLPHGYHQPVIERGRSLSGGQRQLIALARAQLVRPAILILDEATANLDLATEAQVTRAMSKVSEGRTTLLIAHRLQSAARADRIVVLDGGRVVEDGSPDALLAAGGPFADLWATYHGSTTAPPGTTAIAGSPPTLRS
jgi:ATP-binding cassette subfamily B protein